MAKQMEVFAAGKSLRSKLYQLSQDGHYSAAEREGFGRLMSYYHMQLERFLVAPAYGDASAKYDKPLASSQAAETKVPGCQPGAPDSQQPLYDAVHKAAEDLKAVTNPIPRPFKNAPG